MNGVILSRTDFGTTHRVKVVTVEAAGSACFVGFEDRDDPAVAYLSALPPGESLPFEGQVGSIAFTRHDWANFWKFTPDARWFAVVDPDSPRHDSWVLVLGTDAVEVESPEPHRAESPGGKSGPFFRVVVGSLSGEQLEHLQDYLADQWRIPVAAVVMAIMGKHGLPIMAEDVRICSDPDEGRAWFAERRIP